MDFKTLLWTLVLAGTLMVNYCSGEFTCPENSADIYFMLDVSDSVAPVDFSRMKAFVKSFAGSVTLGDSDIRIGLYTFALTAYRIFPLDAYNDTVQLRAAINAATAAGGQRYTNRVISDASLFGFQDQYGGRATVPDIMILMTTGPDVQNILKGNADSARLKNQTLIAIGVGQAVNFKELQDISFVPEYALMVNKSNELKSIQKKLLAIVRRAAARPGTCGDATPEQTVILPNDVQCAAIENLDDGDLKSVTLQCTTSSVYPEAICEFYRTRYEDGISTAVQTQVTYVHTAQNSSSFQSVCSVTIYPKEMGVGIHSFRAHVYPNVTGGKSLVKETILKGIVKLSHSKVKHFCQDDLLDGYFCGKPGYCNCTVVDEGWPKGFAIWMEEGLRKRPNPLTVVYDANKPEVTYTCESVSSLGRTFGSMLKIENEIACS